MAAIIRYLAGMRFVDALRRAFHNKEQLAFTVFPRKRPISQDEISWLMAKWRKWRVGDSLIVKTPS